jgi:hypothetical protein
MSEREERLALLGLGAGASLLEIEDAFSRRYRSADERLAAGDESARVELVVLRRAYEELVGRSPAVPGGAPDWNRPVSLIGDGAPETRRPWWWEGYLAFLLSACSVTLLVELGLRLRHIYHKGGFLLPLVLIVAAAIFSIAATMLSESELEYGQRARLLERKGLEAPEDWVSVRFYFALAASTLARVVRWLALAGLLATIFLNFASLSGRWSLRH